MATYVGGLNNRCGCVSEHTEWGTPELAWFEAFGNPSQEFDTLGAGRVSFSGSVGPRLSFPHPAASPLESVRVPLP